VITISEEMIASSLDRVIGAALTPEAIENRIQREIEKRTATMSIDDAARANGWTPAEFKKLLRRNGINVIALSCRNFRVRVSDIERLQSDNLRPLGKRKRRTSGSGPVPFPKAA